MQLLAKEVLMLLTVRHWEHVPQEGLLRTHWTFLYPLYF